MDISPQNTTQQTISDDQELAKALAGVLPDEPQADTTQADLASATPETEVPEVPVLDFEQTPAPGDNNDESSNAEAAEPEMPSLPPMPEMALPPINQVDSNTETSTDNNLDSSEQVVDPNLAGTENAQPNEELQAIKHDALVELRPLMDKVNLPADEKFNTYLMLIRSTDDATLIGPAHEAAQAIEDEAVRAQALLDIIKEIDYLSRNNQTAA
ncbi:hypothetical protein B7Y94_03015 [Candidatus Saccharibacteria bacterium 32-49-12]|nr:MAG: hypothetical protein B7Y94_03015 [Candidatus Saccharibacteria bacterium 32-49-12]